jgi:hypothetical protein
MLEGKCDIYFNSTSTIIGFQMEMCIRQYENPAMVLLTKVEFLFNISQFQIFLNLVLNFCGLKPIYHSGVNGLHLIFFSFSY